MDGRWEAPGGHGKLLGVSDTASGREDLTGK